MSALSFCNQALIRLGADQITSFSEETAEAEVSLGLYETTLRYLLSAYPWSFATGYKSLGQLKERPLADFDYAYQLPTDFLRALSIGEQSQKNSHGGQYRIRGRAIYTNQSSCLLRYIFRPQEEALPAFFGEALIMRLATAFSLPLTESVTKADLLVKQAQSSYEQAKLIDAQQQTPLTFDDYTLIEVR